LSLESLPLLSYPDGANGLLITPPRSLLVLLLPRLGWINAVGGNLLVFFSGLYLMRGFAVLAAVAAAGGIGGPLTALLVVFVTLFLLPVAALAALALGLTDTLVDWRGRLARAIQKR
jgi:hypothetical protein